MTKYIGIDTGTKLVGWAIVDEQGSYVDSGWVNLETANTKGLSGWDSLSRRLSNLSAWAWGFFAKLEHDHDWEAIVGVEHPWVGKSAQTAITLGMAWGIVAHAVIRAWYSVAKIEPTQAKKALTGSGLARKPAMLEAARIMGGKCEGKGKFDEADALGVALATRIWALERERGTV